MNNTKQNILLVENDSLVYRHVERLLQSEGYHVISLPDGGIIDNYETAVEIVATQRVNLAILDIEINGSKDGLDIGNYIAAHFPRLPIVFLTNYSNVENFRRAGNMGASDFLDKMEKPFTDNQLKRKLQLLKIKMETAATASNEAAVFNVQLVKAKSEEQGFFRKIIKWETVVTITSYNPISGSSQKNNFFFLLNNKEVYRCHEPLKFIDSYLPDFIARFNDTEIIQVALLEGRGKSELVWRMNEKNFIINEANKDKALRAIRLFLHPNP